MTKFIKLYREDRAIQRLFGPKAREVFETEWKPFGWEIVGDDGTEWRDEVADAKAKAARHAARGAKAGDGVREGHEEGRQEGHEKGGLSGAAVETGVPAEAGDGEAAEMAPRRKKKAAAGSATADGGA